MLWGMECRLRRILKFSEEEYMDITSKQFVQAIEQLAYEKKIPTERILETVEAALAAAYRKDFGHPEQHVRARLNKAEGGAEIFVVFNVVEEVENPHMEVTAEEATKRGLKDAKVGDELIEKVDPPEDYGRIAAQTAKQVIIQKIREIEREIVQEEFSDRTGELMTGAVQRVEGRNVFVEIGRALGILGPEDKIEHERYYIGQRLRVLLKEVDSEGRSAQLILTRSHPDFVRRLFELEVPEIHAGTVEIKSIAREAGVRTKVAVHSNQEGVDPVGTCVGQRGTRVQAIMAELGEEKIDIVLYDEDVKQYIMNAMSPAKISRIDLDDDTKTAQIHVADDQLSLAIGRGGQNVRLAGDLTGWQLDIEKSDNQSTQVAGAPLEAIDGIAEEEVAVLTAASIETVQALAAAKEESLAAIEGVEQARLIELQSAASAQLAPPAVADTVENTAPAKEPEVVSEEDTVNDSRREEAGDAASEGSDSAEPDADTSEEAQADDATAEEPAEEGADSKSDQDPETS